MNGASSDTSTSPISNGTSGSHSNLLQPISMQNLLAMACMGQTHLNPAASSQTISSTQLSSTPSLCKLLAIEFDGFRGISTRGFFRVCIFYSTGPIHDYTATIPQYASNIYAPSIANAAISSAVNLVAGKQIEGKLSIFVLFLLI